MGCSPGPCQFSDDQPLHGSICKLHQKVSEDESQDNVSKSESENKASDFVIEDKVIESDNTQVVDSKQISPEKV